MKRRSRSDKSNVASTTNICTSRRRANPKSTSQTNSTPGGRPVSSKFNQVHAAYRPPTICRPPPPTPLPPYIPQPLYVQSEGRLLWPKPGGGVEDWTRSARDIPRISPTYYYAERACAADVLVFEITVNWTLKRIQGALTAYRASIYQSAVSWSPRNFDPDTIWQIQFDGGDFRLPLGATAWLKLWV